MIQLGVLAISSIADWFKSRQEISKVKVEQKIEKQKADHDLEVAIVNAQVRQLEIDGNNAQELDVIRTRDMSKSYFDELLALIAIAPMVLSFIPQFAGYVQDGFIALELMPEWYMALVITVYVVYLGARGFFVKLVTGLGKLFKPSNPLAK